MLRIATTLTLVVLAMAPPFVVPALGGEEAASKPTAAEEPGYQPKPTLPAAPPPLVGGWPSMDALLDDFVKALSKKDKLALLHMRVSQDEFMNLIAPGGVPAGQAPRQNTQKVKDFFWQMADSKSRAYQDVLIERFAGREYKRIKLELTYGTKHYTWYDAHGEVRLTLQDENGAIWHLEAGSIVEAAGQFKFIGYAYD